jgi:hypothetical protein
MKFIDYALTDETANCTEPWVFGRPRFIDRKFTTRMLLVVLIDD